MKKVLIVEDSRTIAKLLQTKLKDDYGINSDTVATLAQAQHRLTHARDDYFIALTNLNQPDAPNGQIIELLNQTKLPGIILTATVSESIRQSIFSNYIIDYVIKRNFDELEHATKMVNRLYKNTQLQAVIMDSSPSFASYLKNLLEMQQFQTRIETDLDKVQQALEHSPQLQLILLDANNLKNVHIIDALRSLRQNRSRSALVIIGLSDDKDQQTAISMLKNGANDIIRKPFLVEEFFSRLHQNLDNLSYLQQIKNYAERDFLTQLYNRRYFFQQANQWYQDTEQQQQSLMIATFDIDHFKHVNDNYGHDAGDAALIHFANILQRGANQPNQLIARFGGEEFCLLQKETDTKHFKQLLEQIRISLMNTPFMFESKKISLTTSIGATTTQEFSYADSLANLLTLADQKLYKAKHNGRNRLEM